MRSIETTSTGARCVRTVFAVFAALVMSAVTILTGGDSAHADLFQIADLTVTVADSSDPVTAGNNLTYTITVTNNGPDAAADASFNDTLPAGTTFVSLPTVAGWGCTPPAVGTGGTVSCSNPSLAVGSSVFTLTVNVGGSIAAGTVLSNTATASSTVAEGNPGDESDTETTTVDASADVSMTTTDSPDPVLAGEDITYTITANNAGPSDAATASVTAGVPSGTTFKSLSSPGGWSCTTPAAGDTGFVSCTNSSMSVGSAQFTLLVTANANNAHGTVVSITATATSSTSDPNSGNESDTATTTVVTPMADLAVTMNGPSTVFAGSDLTYTLTVSNAGPDNAISASISDTLPSGTTFVSLTQSSGPSWSCATPVGPTGAVSCTIATLANGASSSFELVVNVDADNVDGAVISNTATASATTADPNADNNSGTATTTIAHPNEAPVAVDDIAFAFEDAGAASIDVLTNDTDFELGPLTVAAGSWSQGAHGAVTCSTTACSYTPETDFHGVDTFTYVVTDGAYSDSAIVTVAVIPVNDPPVPGTVEAGGGTAEIIVGQDSTITFNVLTDATDPDGDSLTVTGNTQPAHGTATCASDGACSYTPTPGYHGPDSFSYTISDGGGTVLTFALSAPSAATADGTVTITVIEAPPVSTTTTPVPDTAEPTTTTTTTVPITTDAPITAAPTIAPAAAPPSPLPVDLPETGGDVVPALVTGLALIAAGLVVTRRARRRLVLPPEVTG